MALNQAKTVPLMNVSPSDAIHRRCSAQHINLLPSVGMSHKQGHSHSPGTRVFTMCQYRHNAMCGIIAQSVTKKYIFFQTSTPQFPVVVKMGRGHKGLGKVSGFALICNCSRGGGVQGVQNVPRSAWVKTDAANKTANATCVETRRRFLPTRCEVHSVPPVPRGG